MVDRFVVSNIQRLPLFQQLPPAELERLAGFVRVARHNPGDFIFRQGEAARGLYYLNSGQAMLFQTLPDGTQRQIAMVGANQYLNEAALNAEMIESASLYVTQPAVILTLTRAAYQTFLQGPQAYAGAQQPPTVAHPQPPAPQTQQPAPQMSAQPPLHDRYVPPNVQLGPSAYNQPLHPAQKADEEHAVGAGGALEPGVNVQQRRFDGQRPTEKVTYMTRVHWWMAVKNMWKPVLLTVLVLVLAVTLENPLLRLVLFALAFVIPGMLALVYYLEWFNDWLIITNERVLHIEKQILSWTTKVTDTPLQAIQGVNSQRPANILARLMNFGNVVIQTAGDNDDLHLFHIPHPEMIKDYVFQSRTVALEEESRGRQMRMIQSEMDRMFHQQPGHYQAPAPGGAAVAQQNPALPPIQTINRHEVRPRGVFNMRYVDPRGFTIFRTHWWTWLRAAFMPLMLVAAAVLMMAVSLAAEPEVRLALMAGGALILFIGGSWMLVRDWMWRNHYVVLSDREIVRIRRRPLWLQSEEEHILLDRVDNTNAETGGVIRTLLSFGNVAIKLIGDSQPKMLIDVPDPRALREEISARQAHARRAAQEASERRNLNSTLQAINAYHQQQQATVTEEQPAPYVNQGYTRPPFGGGRV